MSNSYVWYGTNSYNFLSETLRNPPEFQPSLCLGCKKKIVLQTEPHSLEPGGVRCSACMMRKMGGRVKPENVYTMDAT